MLNFCADLVARGRGTRMHPRLPHVRPECIYAYKADASAGDSVPCLGALHACHAVHDCWAGMVYCRSKGSISRGYTITQTADKAIPAVCGNTHSRALCIRVKKRDGSAVSLQPLTTCCSHIPTPSVPCFLARQKPLLPVGISLLH